MNWNRAVRWINATVGVLAVLALLGIAGWIEGLS